MSLAEALALHQWASLRRGEHGAAVNAAARIDSFGSARSAGRSPGAGAIGPVVSAVQSHRGVGRGALSGKFVVGHWQGERAIWRRAGVGQPGGSIACPAPVLRPAGGGRQRGSRLGVGPLRTIVADRPTHSDAPLPERPTSASASRLAIAPPGRLPEILADLPIEALRLDAKALDNLGQLGVERVEQLAALPRAGLATRFGPALLRRLDEALAATAEVITPCRLPAEFEAAWLFESPTAQARRNRVCAGAVVAPAYRAFGPPAARSARACRPLGLPAVRALPSDPEIVPSECFQPPSARHVPLAAGNHPTSLAGNGNPSGSDRGRSFAARAANPVRSRIAPDRSSASGPSGRSPDPSIGPRGGFAAAVSGRCPAGTCLPISAP